MASRKPGNPDQKDAAPIPLSIPRGGDWLDNYESAEPVETPAPTTVAPSKAEPERPTPPIVELVEDPKPKTKPDKAAATNPSPKKKTTTAKRKSGPAPAANKRPKKRPKRADIGFRDDLEEASAKLRKHVLSQADEDFVTRTDVIAQATCAVATAIDSIHCGQVGRRGHYASTSADAYDQALREAFYKGVALHFIENNIHQLPDRLLQQCYEAYKQRNGLLDD